MVTRLLNAKNGEASSVCDRQKWVSRKLKSWTPKKAHGEKALQASCSYIKATVRNFWWTLAGVRTWWMIDPQACWDRLHQGWPDTTHTIVILKLRYFSSIIFVMFLFLFCKWDWVPGSKEDPPCWLFWLKCGNKLHLDAALWENWRWPAH